MELRSSMLVLVFSMCSYGQGQGSIAIFSGKHMCAAALNIDAAVGVHASAQDRIA